MSNRLSCLGALAAFIVAAFLSPFSRVAGSKGKNFYLYDFCIMKCKMALLLSAFAFAPSVLSDVPVVTLSVDNIQVRAEWRVVPQDNPDFRMEGNTLVFQSNISGAGKPNGATIIATVEVLDKFSTLNPLYEDLTTRVKITTVVMGCHGHERVQFAKSYHNSGLIAVRYGFPIKKDDVILREHGSPPNKRYFLYTVSIVHHEKFHDAQNDAFDKAFISTMPDLYGILGYDSVLGNNDYRTYDVNGGVNCFDKKIESIDEANRIEQERRAKIQYLNANAPKLNTGVFAGEDVRVITVGTAFKIGSEQFFYLYDVTLANILKELYPIKVINDDGKAFSIHNRYPSGNKYEYVANFTGSDYVHGDDYNKPHEVIIVKDCPATTPVTVNAWYSAEGEGSLRIAEADISKANVKYVLIQGKVYKSNGTTPIASSGFIVDAEGFSASGLDFGAYKIKYSNSHFLCESI